MPTSELPLDNTTAPPPSTGTSPVPEADTDPTTEPPTNVAITTPGVTTTKKPGETLVNKNIVGHQLGAKDLPKKGDGGVANSYAKTTGSVELLSVGINKQFYGPLTYEVFDFYGDGAPIDPINVFSGKTSVVNWDEASQTGVIPINKIIPCKSVPTNLDGSMDIQVIIKDQSLHPLYLNINIPNSDVTP